MHGGAVGATPVAIAGTPTGQRQDPPRHRRRGWFLAALLCVAALLRFPSLLCPLTNDEAGFLLVSRSWNPTPDSLFGGYWVDRSPVLIGTYRLGDELFGAYGPRLLAAGLALVMVAVLFDSARRLAGPAAARWCGVGALVLVSTPTLQTWTGKGEMLGVPLVAVSCWLWILALRSTVRSPRLLLASGAGLAAALALGLKQNLVGGLVFGGVLVAGSVLGGRLGPKDGARLAAAALAGAAAPLVGVLVWAAANGVHLTTLWSQVYGFRSAASAVLASGYLDEPAARASRLVDLSVRTCMVPVMALFLVCFPRLRSLLSVEWAAVLTMFAVDVVGAALGGSYWTAYLIPLIPSVALAAGLAGSVPGWRGLGGRLLVLVAVVSCLDSLVTFTGGRLSGDVTSSTYYAGQAVGRSARPSDTIVVLYGNPDTVQASGLHSPYPYLWSLPVRTLDPHLALLRRQLSGPAAPTWVVATVPLDSWGLDADGRLARLLAHRYVRVGEPCGEVVWRLEDRARPPLPRIDCHRPWL